jgi:hypothetical protein
MTLLPVLALAPWDAMAAPALINAVRASSILLRTEEDLSLDKDRSYITKDEDPCVPFGSNAREPSSVNDDTSEFSLRVSFRQSAEPTYASESNISHPQ